MFTVPGGPIPSGQSRSFEVETQGRFDRLSLLTMLVNTNDAFTGLDSRRVHGNGAVIETMAYDAGSERNNELAAFIPGPCCNTRSFAPPKAASSVRATASPASATSIRLESSAPPW